MPEQTGGMGNLAGRTAQDVNAMLSDTETQLLLRTSARLEALRPQIQDRDSFEKLLQAVKASTTANESAAQLQSRVVALGDGVVTVAKKVATLVV